MNLVLTGQIFQEDDKLPGPHCPLVFLYPCLSSCTQFCIQSPSHHFHVYTMKNYDAMAPQSTQPSAVEKHMRTGQRIKKGFWLGSSSAFHHHWPYLPCALSHTCKQQEQQCWSQAPSSSAAISESTFLFLLIKHSLKNDSTWCFPTHSVAIWNLSFEQVLAL